MLNETLSFIGALVAKRLVICQLARQDFRNRYLGLSLGFIWTFIQPLAMVLILWAVFTVAFRVPDAEGVPFSFYLLTGIAGWNFFSESLGAATGVFHEYAFMVKKVNFEIAILPLVKILSCLIVHVIFLLVVMALLLAGGCRFSPCWLQTAYYVFAMSAFLAGLCWITSSINVFTRDVAQVVNILLQFGFWLTPVVWNPIMVPEQYRWILKLNPLFYIIEGYRASLVYQVPFWRDLRWTIYFWAVTLVVLFLGIVVFRRLKPHFADVL